MTLRGNQLWGLGIGLVLIAGYARVLAWALDDQSYNVWGGMIWFVIIIAVNGFLIWAAAVREKDPWITRLLIIGFIAKICGVFGRYFVAFVVYRGIADASAYNYYAATHYQAWRLGEWTWEVGGKQGTQYMEVITTAVYAVIGPSPLAGFFVFGSFAFWGVYLIFRALRTALPGADYRRYAALLFLLPTMLYWPSSIGKESWLMLWAGVVALGAAKFFTRNMIGGSILLTLGFAGLALVRPHIAVLMAAALFVGQVVQPTDRRSTSILTKAAGVTVLGLVALILTTQSASFLGIDDLNWQSVSESVEGAGDKTGQGGSAFTPLPLNHPLGIPAAIVTLLFRPFPWEAHNIQMFVQSLEGIFLLALSIKSWPRLRSLPRLLRRSPYLVFCLVFTLAFIIAFAGFANFGILARQRVLMLPFYLVLLALPLPVRQEEEQVEAWEPDEAFEYDLPKVRVT